MRWMRLNILNVRIAKMKNYKITSKEELDAIALEKHPVEIDASGHDKNNFVRQVFINGYLLGMKAIIELNQQNQKR